MTKRFNDYTAVNDVSLDIYRGEFVALLGPNGAGKTTLVEMLEGLKQPEAGSIRILGRSWQKDESYLRHRLAGVLQESLFINKLRVDETVNLFASFYRRPRSRADEVLELVELIPKRKVMVEGLSGGQRQRLALAISILNQPEILILDEPTTGLDPQVRRGTWDILRKLNKELGSTMLLTTHYMEEAEYLCDRICIMHQGRILTQGTLDELLAAHEPGEVVEYRVKSGAGGAEQAQGQYHQLQLRPGVRQGAAAGAQRLGLPVPPVRVHPRTTNRHRRNHRAQKHWTIYSCHWPAEVSMNNALLNLIITQFRQYLREPQILFWSFGFPLLLVWLLGVSFSGGEIKERTIGVVLPANVQEQAAVRAWISKVEARNQPLSSVINADEIKRDHLIRMKYRFQYYPDRESVLRGLKRGDVQVFMEPSADSGKRIYYLDPQNNEALLTYFFLGDDPDALSQAVDKNMSVLDSPACATSTSWCPAWWRWR